jgi:tetratricopeptide (TPR) repeat protein/DNA-binding winged helix-turn-helix (wHTH) protein/TolB-like protein
MDPTARSYRFGNFVMHPERRLLLRDGGTVPLAPKAFDTLILLIERRGQLVEKQELMDAIWPDTIVEENNLTQVISALRKVLGTDSAGRSYIETVPRRGYRFVGLVTSELESVANQFAREDFGTLRFRHAWTRPLVVLGLVVGLLATALILFTVPRAWVSNLAWRGTQAISGPISNAGQYVVVLPFGAESNQKSLGYFAEGLSEALAARLGSLPGIRAVSVGEMAGLIRTRPLTEIGRELGATLIVQGSVEGIPERMRVTVALYDVAGRREVWRQQFLTQTSRVFDVEDRIFSGLTSSLESRGPAPESARGARPTQDVKAYDLYLRGRNALRYQQGIGDLENSVGFFQQAVDKDPQFALAYAGLAEASQQVYEETKDSLWLAKALNAAQLSRQLNDNLAEAHSALGDVYTAYGRGHDAVRELRRSLELAPNSDETHRWLGHAYMSMGRTGEALAAYERAVVLDPYYWLNYNVLGVACFQLGDNDRALNAFRRVTELEPDNVDGYENLGTVNLRLGNWNESIRYYEQALKIRPNFGIYSNLGTAYFYLKRYSEAVRMFERAAEINPDEETVEGNLADAYRWSGQHEKAVAAYRKAIAMAYRELQVNPNDAATTAHLALYYAKEGDVGKGLILIHRARALDHANVRLIYNEAAIQSLAGNAEAALNCLREAFEKGYPPTEAKTDPELSGVQRRPEFERLVAAFSGKKS